MLMRDPVHGLISFEADEERIVVELLATPELQRLRRIRQLGLTCLAFPGAVHTRFSHALGAAHVMQQLILRLRKIHHELPISQRLSSECARDAIAAALLHDVGHGPLSHLFEDAVAHACPENARHHEAWTAQVLCEPGTGVNTVLGQHDPELPARVAQLIAGHHELPYLARSVSGTFDVDRCDYLLRDAHSTGVGYGDFDLAWLIRSLRFGESHDGQAPGLAIDGPKGLTAIESFILARLFMFQQVYFHKSTRAAECMIIAILRRALVLLQQGVRLAHTPSAMHALARGEQPPLGEYLDLDDHVLLETIKEWRHAEDPILKDLCQRLHTRTLFKTEELFGEAATKTGQERALALVREIAQDAGFAPDSYAHLDLATVTPYEEDRSLMVHFGRGPHRCPSEVSFVLDRVKNESLTRVRLVFPGEVRERVQQALETL
ncbi:MAG: HD domain-containing protein [Myxococcales bacterium]|nr:HD domain-containing protein [Myxococcales bacterium]